MTASRSRETAHRALKRLLANGPLTAVPTRPSDQQILVALAVSQFETQRTSLNLSIDLDLNRCAFFDHFLVNKDIEVKLFSSFGVV